MANRVSTHCLVPARPVTRSSRERNDDVTVGGDAGRVTHSSLIPRIGLSRTSRWLGVLCLVAGLASAGPARGQSDTGSLRVLVLDQTGAVVPGATVTLRNVGTAAPREAVSDGEGYVTFTPLTRGRYDVRVDLSGFRTVEFTDVDIDVNEREFVRVALDAAAAAETVQVTAQRAILQTEEGSIGQVITGDVAVELPLAARRYTRAGAARARHRPSTMTVETRGPGLVRLQRQLPHAEQLHARRLRQQPGHAERAVALGAGRAALPGCHRRVQGADQQLLGGVRPLGRRGGQRLAQVGQQPGPRVGVLLQPRQVAGGHSRGSRTCSGSEGRPRRGTRAAARSAGRSREQAVLLRLVRGLPPELLHDRLPRRCRPLAQRQGVFNSDVRDPATGQPFAERHDSAGALGSARRQAARPVSRSRTATGARSRRPRHRQLRRAAAGPGEHAQVRPPHRPRPERRRPPDGALQLPAAGHLPRGDLPDARRRLGNQGEQYNRNQSLGLGLDEDHRDADGQRGAPRLQPHPLALRACDGQRHHGRRVRLRRPARRVPDHRRHAAHRLQQLQRPRHPQLPAAVPEPDHVAVRSTR